MRVLRNTFVVALSLSGTCLIGASAAFANIGDDFGFGSRTAALAGAGAAGGFEGFAAYANPAGLAIVPADPAKRMIFSIGIVDMNPSFNDINNVVIENNYISDKPSPIYGDVDTSYLATFGLEIGSSFRLLPNWENLTIGVAGYLPVNQIAYMDTGEAFQPEFFQFRSRTQRPGIEVGLGADTGKGFHFGLGLHTAFALTTNANVFLASATNQASTIRFTSSLKPKFAPVLSALYRSPDNDRVPTFGLVWRGSVASESYMSLTTDAQLLGSLASVGLGFNASSAIFYDPETVELGTTWMHSWAPTVLGRLYLQADYQRWSDFQSANPDVNPSPSSGLAVSPGNNPTFNFKNIIIPRLAEEVMKGSVTYRLGFAYRPSTIDLGPETDGVYTTGPGNYLDPPRFIYTAGIGFAFNRFLSINTPWTLDLNLGYQALKSQTIVKTPGNEIGDTTSAKIGSPGYVAAGKVYGGGATMNIQF